MSNVEHVHVQLYYSGGWHDVPAYTREGGLVITRGTDGEQAGITPSTVTGVKIDNRSMAYNPRNRASALYGLIGRNTPVRVVYDPGGGGEDVRLYGEVASWTPGRTMDFDPSTGRGDAWVDIEISGQLRRADTSPVHSPLYRAHLLNPDIRPLVVGYWPFEDDEHVGQYTSPIPGVQPAVYVQRTASYRPLVWEDETLISSAKLPQLQSAFGNSATTAPCAFTPGTSFAISFWARTPLPGSTDSVQIQNYTTLQLRNTGASNHPAVQLIMNPPNSNGVLGTASTISILALVADDAGFTVDSGRVDNLPYTDQWRHVVCVYTPGGGSTLGVTVLLDGAVVLTDTLTGVTLGTPRELQAFQTIFSSGSAEIPVLSYGHPAVLSGGTAAIGTAAQAIWYAGRGHAGETTGARFARLAGEAGYTTAVSGTADRPMGPQRFGVSFGELIDDCARTDGGLAFETREGPGLFLRAADSLYNQTAALTLDWDDAVIADPWQPTIDDQLTVNDVTARNPATNANYRISLETGRMGAQDPPVGVGRKAQPIDVSPLADDDLADLAGFALYRGTVDEIRLAQLTVDLTATPAIRAAASDLDIGDVIHVVNLPADLGTDTLKLLVVGASEAIEAAHRTLTWNCVPATPYDVAVAVDASSTPTLTEQRVCSDYSTLNADITAGAVSITWATTGGETWTTDPADFPLWVTIDHETIEISAITGSGPYTATVATRGVIGAAAAHSSGAPVDVAYPAILGL